MRMPNLFLFIGVVLFVLSGQRSEALDCCPGYRDVTGKDHYPELCMTYCCVRVGFKVTECCDDYKWRIPISDKETQNCYKEWTKLRIVQAATTVDWLIQHKWVMPVCGFVAILIYLVDVLIELTIMLLRYLYKKIF
ncbi:uncharacterized protein LOC132747394 [Ruditapes philippinarum]|uniref:uncharacterized protein LOC132747394 n=1 Tax=Ruditapes philippinarum TaxID=129788 RepID=UPI00295BB6A5|nr:uncharacterized protein LOC132747394 [Ruditapes philippinarum]